jgi:hypothetical protein
LAAAFAEALEEADSDYVRAVLEDGRITEAEFAEAQQSVVACLSDLDITARYVKDELGLTSLEVTGELNAEESKAELKCEEEWMGQIHYLHDLAITNPNGEDWNSLIAACLVRKGLAPGDFGGDDYAELIEPMGTTIAPAESDEPGMHSLSPPETMPTLPGGISLDDPGVRACEANPQWSE